MNNFEQRFRHYLIKYKLIFLKLNTNFNRTRQPSDFIVITNKHIHFYELKSRNKDYFHLQDLTQYTKLLNIYNQHNPIIKLHILIKLNKNIYDLPFEYIINLSKKSLNSRVLDPDFPPEKKLSNIITRLKQENE